MNNSTSAFLATGIILERNTSVPDFEPRLSGDETHVTALPMLAFSRPCSFAYINSDAGPDIIPNCQ
jgi:hypothetical protein